MSAHDKANYSLTLAFDSDDPEFIRGVEAGRLYEQLRGDGEVHQSIHATNVEMAMRICEAHGRTFKAEDLDERWVDLHVDERTSA